MNRQQRRAAGRAGRVTFASLPGWREASAEALRRWAGLYKLLRGKGLKADSIKKLLSVPVEGGAQ